MQYRQQVDQLGQMLERRIRRWKPYRRQSEVESEAKLRGECSAREFRQDLRKGEVHTLATV